MTQQEYLRISTLQMYYFIEVASCNSFTNAAQHLYTTQSTLSKTISSLEKTLDVQLFIRNHKRLYLTEAGQHLYKKWRLLLTDIEKSVDECRILQGGYAHSLSIGVLDSHNSEKITSPIIRKFMRENPNVNISVNAYPAQEIRKHLISGNLDLAFTVLYDIEQLDADAFDSIILNICNHSVCMLPANPLTDKEFLEVSDLKNCQFVSISPLYTPSYCGMIEDLCKQHGFQPHFIRYTTNAISLPYNLIGENDIFICDRNFREYQNPSLHFLQFRPLIHTNSGVIAAWKKDNAKKELKRLIEKISEEKKSRMGL